jgi:hypothetical protein
MHALATVALAATVAAPAGLQLQHTTRDSREYVDPASVQGPTALRQVRWVTDTQAERRIDLFVFDCGRHRFVHVATERQRSGIRVESIVLPEARWPTSLASMPFKYPQTPLHRARAVACSDPARRP